MVYYRKYRPQTIDDLDNPEIRAALTSLFGEKSKTAPHAFLFTGPKGLGKTSTARIIAKVVNCENKKGAEPCNTCDQCLSITNGTNMDILEIDAASNRGIDEIRELKEKIRLAPMKAKKKVYIIDEVHMLTTEAFNALLKTLEEPPDHAMFILCTTESHKIPSTILSRCFHLSFHLATEEELVRSFKRIAKGEKFEIDDDALQMVASLAEGGFRDGVKILEELVSIAGEQSINRAFVEERYKVSSIKQHVLSLLDSLHKKDTKAGLHVIGILVEQGIDLKHFLQSVMEELHSALLKQVGVESGSMNQELGIGELRELFELFSKASVEMKTAVLPQLPLELAIITYCQDAISAKSKATRQSPPRSEEDEVDQSDSAMTTKEDVTVSSLRKQVGTMKKIQALYGEKKDTPKDSNEIEVSKVELLHAPTEGEISKQWMDALWKHIIAEMKQHNHTVAGVLRGCSIKSYDRKTLIILANYKFHKEKLDEAKTRDALMKVCKILTGNDVQVEVELKK